MRPIPFPSQISNFQFEIPCLPLGCSNRIKKLNDESNRPSRWISTQFAPLSRGGMPIASKQRGWHGNSNTDGVQIVFATGARYWEPTGPTMWFAVFSGLLGA